MKKTSTLAVLITAAIALSGCASSSKNSSTVSTKDSKTASVKNENQDKTVNNMNFKSYSELKEFGKKRTQKISADMDKYNIAKVTTPDNMYLGNEVKSYKKYDNTYVYNIIYMVKPNFKYGQGAELLHINYESHIDDKYSKNDINVEVIADILSDMGQKISIDEFVSNLNKYAANAGSDPSKSYQAQLGKNNEGTVQIQIKDNKKTLVIKYANNFKNFKVEPVQMNFDTVAEFKDFSTANSKVENVMKKENMIKDDQYSLSYKDPSGQAHMNITTRGDVSNTDGTMSQELYIAPQFFKYPDTFEASTASVNVVVDLMKEFKVMDKLSDSDIVDYIKSIAVYSKNQNEQYYLQDDNIRYYSLPAADIDVRDHDGISNDYVQGSYDVDKLNGDQFQFEIKFKLPVTAEGKNRI